MIPIDLSPVANHLWQSTFFAIAAALLVLALRKNRAAVRYWIWFAAAVKFLIPFSFLVGLGAQLEWRQAPQIATPPIASAIYEFSQPFAIPADALPATTVSQAAHSNLPVIVLVIWLCGIMLGLIHWIRLLLRLRAIERAATPLPLSLPIPVLEASEKTRLEPGVFGIFKPVLILPARITDRLTPQQLEAVLAHELCHVRRKDNLTAAIQLLVEIVFWFHPFVWWIRERLVAEREQACDEEVAGDPQVYAEAILQVCKLYLESPLICVSGVTGSDLKRRISAILESRPALQLNFTRKAALTVAIVAALALPIVVGISNETSVHAQQPTFEVASVKRAGRPEAQPMVCLVPCFPGERMTIQGSHVDIRFMSLQKLLLTAYRLKPYQLSGPDWLRSPRFDIMAKIPEGVSGDRVPVMLRALLIDRFKLTVHRETKELPVYALVVGRNGFKLKKSDPDSIASLPNSPNGRGLYTSDGDAHVEPDGSVVITAGPFGPVRRLPGPGLRWEMLQLSMPGMVELLAPHEDRPVVDRTNLQGTYRFVWGDSISSGAPPPPPPTEGNRTEIGPGTAMRDPLGEGLTQAIEKAGLRLDRSSAAVDMIVVSHIERTPTEN